MKEIAYILQRVFVREFYAANAAFFLVVLGLCFGIMSGVEHKALGQFFISSPQLLLIPVIVWIVYTLKVVQFNRKTLRHARNEFIYHVILLKKSWQWIALLSVLIPQLMPVIAYGAFLSVMAYQHTFFPSILYTLLSISILTIVGVLIFAYDLGQPNRERKVSRTEEFLNTTISRPYVLFFPEWIARTNLTSLFSTKLFSCLFILATTKLYADDYDWRLLGLGLTIAFSGNIVLIFHYHRFENFHFSISRNLPLPLLKRLAYFLSVFVMLTLPEFGLLIKNFPLSLPLLSLAQFIFFSLSIGVLFYTALYIKDINLEHFLQKAFILIMVWIVLILFNVPLWVFTLANLFIGQFLFMRYYYSFEYRSSIGAQK